MKSSAAAVSSPAIRPHNEGAAALWGAGGDAYDEVSFAISDALAHAAQRLDAQAGERVLDIATGTGWSARNAARAGASVTGIDIAEPLLAAARDRSAHVHPPIEFKHGDAEALPFPDASFDKAISTFGIMFAADQDAAAREAARVLKPGGRLVIAAWSPGGAVAEFFKVIASHAGGPPPERSPMAWGERDGITALLGENFDLMFENGTNNAYHASEEAIWRWYVAGFGPLKALHQRLDEGGRQKLRSDVDAYHAHYRAPAGLHVAREYLLTIATRR